MISFGSFPYIGANSLFDQTRFSLRNKPLHVPVVTMKDDMRYSDTVSVFYQGSEKKDNVQQPNLLQENFQEKQELIFFFIKNLKV